MAVLSLARSGFVVGGEDLLDSVEELAGHDRLVRADLLDPVPFDNPDVDLVSEKRCHLGPRDRQTRSSPQPAGLKFFVEVGDRPTARGVELEGFGYLLGDRLGATPRSPMWVPPGYRVRADFLVEVAVTAHAPFIGTAACDRPRRPTCSFRRSSPDRSVCRR